jgi:hypothetical protein
MHGYVKKLDKATMYENLEIGDKVRLKRKRKSFDKGSFMTIWTTTIHMITKIDGLKYYVSGCVSSYKHSELQKINIVEENPDLRSSFLRNLQGRPVKDTERNLRAHKAHQSTRRRLTREGI